MKRILCWLVLVFSILSCSSNHKSFSAYRDGFSFSTVEHYSLYQRNSTFSEWQNLTDATRNTIELAIEQEMDNQGFTLVEVAQADIIFSYYVVTGAIAELKIYNREVNFCSYCLRAGNNTRKELEKSYRPGSLIIDIINPQNNSSVWRASAPLRFKTKDNSHKRSNKIKRVIATMLNDYPG